MLVRASVPAAGVQLAVPWDECCATTEPSVPGGPADGSESASAAAVNAAVGEECSSGSQDGCNHPYTDRCCASAATGVATVTVDTRGAGLSVGGGRCGLCRKATATADERAQSHVVRKAAAEPRTDPAACSVRSPAHAAANAISAAGQLYLTRWATSAEMDARNGRQPRARRIRWMGSAGAVELVSARRMPGSARNPLRSSSKTARALASASLLSGATGCTRMCKLAVQRMGAASGIAGELT